MAGDAIVQLSEQIGRLAAAQEATAVAFQAHDREETEDRRNRSAREAEELRRLYDRLDGLKQRQDQIEGAYRAIIVVGSILSGLIGLGLAAFSSIKGG